LYRNATAHEREFRAPNRASAFFLLLLFFLVIFTAAGIALLATRLLVLLVAASFVAVLAMILAAAIPNGVCEDIENLDRGNRIVALNHQLTAPWTLFGGTILNDDREARTRTQGCWERIVEQFPVAALPLEVHAGHVQSAVADIADGCGAICATAGVHAAKDSGASYGEPPGGRVAFNLNNMRRGWIGTDNRDFCGLKRIGTGRKLPAAMTSG
jgi:hypothetical protein